MNPVFVAAAVAHAIARLTCWLRGHSMTHHDPAYGKRPTILAIYCDRCGGELELRIIERSAGAALPAGVM